MGELEATPKHALSAPRVLSLFLFRVIIERLHLPPVTAMSDPSDTVDSYLAERFKIGLEQVLVDASVGKTAPGLAGTVEVTCRERGCYHYRDRGRVAPQRPERHARLLAPRFSRSIAFFRPPAPSGNPDFRNAGKGSGSCCC